MAELRWVSGADPVGWDDLADLFTRRNQEAIPTDRPASAEELRSGALHAPADQRTFQVLVVEDDQAVGAAAMGMDGIRAESAWLTFLFVVPAFRRRGVGSALLAAVRDVARRNGRTLIRTSTVVGLPEGTRFAERAGARPGLVVAQSRCPTANLDAVQLRSWCDRAGERAAAYSLVAFDGVCPEEHLDAFVAAIPIMNTAPRTETTEDFTPSREQVVGHMTAVVRQGTSIWTVCARDDRSGEFVGYSELYFSVHRRWLAGQGDTGVHPNHRERGIGRWLKAHNASRLLAERPDVEFIETWNANTNAAMLSINRAMGFEVVARRQEWDVPV